MRKEKIAKIVSWNVNGIRAVERKKALQAFIESKPDILLLQEIKGRTDQFSSYLTDNEGYQQYYHSAEKAGYAGTGIWMKKDFFNEISDASFDTQVPRLINADEGRVSHVQFTFDGTPYSIFSIYFPNGGKSDQAWKEKLIFYEDILAYMNRLHEEGRVVIVGGDMNVAHNPIDIARPRENEGKIGFHPEERAWMDRVMEQGWVDTWRALHPDEVKYSWWNVVTRARERNVGWRIDYIFVHREYFKNVQEAFIENDVYGSDHCPVGIQYKL